MKQAPLLDIDPAARRAEDFYATPGWQTSALLRRLPLWPCWRIVEPCAGDGAIVSRLPAATEVITNDIVARPPFLPDFLLDARQPDTWTAFRARGPLHVAVTNPPFNEAFAIAQAAYPAVEIALVLLLRLSWLEPTDERGPWLRVLPPARLIVMPRTDYRGNGSTDSVTSAWMVWPKTPGVIAPGIDVVTKDERDALIASEALECQ